MSRMREAVSAAALESPQTVAGGGWLRRYRFDPDFLGFSGHFPGYPVVPAVVQVLAAVELVGAGSGRDCSLVGVEHAKFLIQLHPGDEITVRCTPKAAAGRELWEARLDVAAGVAASFQLQLTEEPRC